jgi:hypothetical protein
MLDPNAAIMSWEQADQIIQDQRAEIARLKEAISRLADQDATMSVCNGNVTVDCSTEVKLELTDEQRAVLAAAIENDRKRGVMLVPGPQAFTLTDEELRALMHGAISLRMHAGELSNTEAVENIMNLAKTLDSLREKHERHAT